MYQLHLNQHVQEESKGPRYVTTPSQPTRPGRKQRTKVCINSISTNTYRKKAKDQGMYQLHLNQHVQEESKGPRYVSTPSQPTRTGRKQRPRYVSTPSQPTRTGRKQRTKVCINSISTNTYRKKAKDQGMYQLHLNQHVQEESKGPRYVSTPSQPTRTGRKQRTKVCINSISTNMYRKKAKDQGMYQLHLNQHVQEESKGPRYVSTPSQPTRTGRKQRTKVCINSISTNTYRKKAKDQGMYQLHLNQHVQEESKDQGMYQLHLNQHVQEESKGPRYAGRKQRTKVCINSISTNTYRKKAKDQGMYQLHLNQHVQEESKGPRYVSTPSQPTCTGRKQRTKVCINSISTNTSRKKAKDQGMYQLHLNQHVQEESKGPRYVSTPSQPTRTGRKQRTKVCINSISTNTYRKKAKDQGMYQLHLNQHVQEESKGPRYVSTPSQPTRTGRKQRTKVCNNSISTNTSRKKAKDQGMYQLHLNQHQEESKGPRYVSTPSQPTRTGRKQRTKVCNNSISTNTYRKKAKDQGMYQLHLNQHVQEESKGPRYVSTPSQPTRTGRKQRTKVCNNSISTNTSRKKRTKVCINSISTNTYRKKAKDQGMYQLHLNQHVQEESKGPRYVSNRKKAKDQGMYQLHLNQHVQEESKGPRYVSTPSQPTRTGRKQRTKVCINSISTNTYRKKAKDQGMYQLHLNQHVQ